MQFDILGGKDLHFLHYKCIFPLQMIYLFSDAFRLFESVLLEGSLRCSPLECLLDAVHFVLCDFIYYSLNPAREVMLTSF